MSKTTVTMLVTEFLYWVVLREQQGEGPTDDVHHW